MYGPFAGTNMELLYVERWPSVEVRLYSVLPSSRLKAHYCYNEPLSLLAPCVTLYNYRDSAYM